ELYAYYRRTEYMLDNVLRDEAAMPLITKMLGGYRTYLADARETVLRGRRARGGSRERLRAAVGHALAFASWRSLAREQGLDDRAAAELMCRLVVAAAQAG